MKFNIQSNIPRNEGRQRYECFRSVTVEAAASAAVKTVHFEHPFIIFGKEAGKDIDSFAMNESRWKSSSWRWKN